MQFLKWPFLMLWRAVTLGASVSQIRAVADRVDRHGDRFRNAGDTTHAHLADEYAGRIRQCFTETGALELEEDFLVAIGLKQRSPGAVVRDYESDTWNSGSSGHTPSSYGGTSYRSSSDFGSGSSGTPSSDSSGPSSSDASFTGGGGESGGGGASGSWDTDATDSGAAGDNSDNS